MSLADRERWNLKYSKGYRTSLHKTLLDFYHLAPLGRALELACGTGENAIFLAQKGFQVDAVDISDVAIDVARNKARELNLNINFIVADLDEYPLKEEYYHLVVVFYYLNRTLAAPIVRSLKRGGVLIYETYNRNHLHIRGDFNPDYLLEEGELLRLFKDLQVIHYREEFNVSTFVGRKP